MYLFPAQSWNSFIISYVCWTLHDSETQWMSCWRGEDGPQGPVPQDAWPSGCHQHQLRPLSFPWWMLCMNLCCNPWGSSLTGPEAWRALLTHTHTHTHTLEALFPLLWQHVIGRSDVIEGVKAQHSDSDSLRRTLLVSLPVVVQTCWDCLSNKAKTHQSPLDQLQSAIHLIHSLHGSTATVQNILPRVQLLEIGTLLSLIVFYRKSVGLNKWASKPDPALSINPLYIHCDHSRIKLYRLTGITAIFQCSPCQVHHMAHLVHLTF